MRRRGGLPATASTTATRSPLTGLTARIDQLRTGIEALAAKVRRHEEQLALRGVKAEMPADLAPRQATPR